MSNKLEEWNLRTAAGKYDFKGAHIMFRNTMYVLKYNEWETECIRMMNYIFLYLNYIVWNIFKVIEYQISLNLDLSRNNISSDNIIIMMEITKTKAKIPQAEIQH